MMVVDILVALVFALLFAALFGALFRGRTGAPGFRAHFFAPKQGRPPHALSALTIFT